MFKNERVLAVITARGGSKGLPGKNIRQLGGKPLIAWTILAAKQSAFIDRLVLSSDDENICKVAEEYGCDVPFIRPEELATDTADSISVLVHAIENVREKYDIVVLLQPTSPFRTAQDIDSCISMVNVERDISSVSVCNSSKSPNWMYWLDSETNHLEPILNADNVPTRRQDIRPAYVLNGAVYASGIKKLQRDLNLVDENSRAHVMTEESSIDIDTLIDFKLAQYILESKNG